MGIKLGEVYKCNVCGNIVMAIHEGKGDLVCCGEDMKLMKENTVDAAVEKHVPVWTRDGDKITVKVGSVAHPME
ncbi:MAG: desulfoferrodoxin FeS4 iron-binding domain-containing protein, partial [Proteobacteria bacterium]|nr:desulfoferrodoxin FeS4 iron-binding domain-containing protein [Pseudomonadota bacterium]